MVVGRSFEVFWRCLFFVVLFPAAVVSAGESLEASDQTAERQEEIGAVEQARQQLDARRVEGREATLAVYFLVCLAVGAPLLALMLHIFLTGGRKPYVIDSAAELEKAQSHNDEDPRR